MTDLIKFQMNFSTGTKYHFPLVKDDRRNWKNRTVHEL